VEFFLGRERKQQERGGGRQEQSHGNVKKMKQEKHETDHQN